MGQGRKLQHDTAGAEGSEAGPPVAGASTAFAPLVEALVSTGPERHAAAVTLQRTLRSQVARVLRGRDGGDLVDDVVNTTLIKILSAPDTFRDKHWGYLRKVVLNEIKTGWRKRKRELPVPVEDTAFSHQEAPELADPVEVEQRWALLDRAHAAAVASRRPQDRSALEESWPQLKALIEGSTDMPALVAEEVARGAAAKPPVRQSPDQVQNRIYQTHTRCRRALARSLDAIEAEGQWAPEDLAFARGQMTALLRAGRPSSSKT